MEPLYVEVKKKITQSLIQGEWGPGEAIPSEIELANIYDALLYHIMLVYSTVSYNMIYYIILLSVIMSCYITAAWRSQVESELARLQRQVAELEGNGCKL